MAYGLKACSCHPLSFSGPDQFSNANAKNMHATINGLLNKSIKALHVLELKTEKEVADEFLSLFIAKVEKIRAKLGSNVTDFVDERNMFHPNQVTRVHNFNLLIPGDVKKIIQNFPQ